MVPNMASRAPLQSVRAQAFRQSPHSLIVEHLPSIHIRQRLQSQAAFIFGSPIKRPVNLAAAKLMTVRQ
tara:strand:- start:2045 stop:2251 length:207 start_codon:yes stop_codon:yes gene_type:complete